MREASCVFIPFWVEIGCATERCERTLLVYETHYRRKTKKWAVLFVIEVVHWCNRTGTSIIVISPTRVVKKTMCLWKDINHWSILL